MDNFELVLTRTELLQVRCALDNRIGCLKSDRDDFRKNRTYEQIRSVNDCLTDCENVLFKLDKIING